MEIHAQHLKSPKTKGLFPYAKTYINMKSLEKHVKPWTMQQIDAKIISVVSLKCREIGENKHTWTYI